MSLQKATNFIRQHGDAVEQARLDHLLGAVRESPPSSPTLARLNPTGPDQ